MEFLNILFIIVLVIVALRLFMRYVFPFLLLRYFRKKQDEFMGKTKDDRKKDRKTGEVNVDYKPDPLKKSKLDDVGEYTDFEEVDDDK